MIIESIQNAHSPAEAAFYATRMCETLEEREAAYNGFVGVLERGRNLSDDSEVARILAEAANPILIQEATERGVDMSEHMDTFQADREKLDGLIDRLQMSFDSSPGF